MNEVVPYKIKLKKYENTNLDDMLRKQRRNDDLTWIGFELGQCSSDKKDKYLFEIFKYETKDTNQNTTTSSVGKNEDFNHIYNDKNQVISIISFMGKWYSNMFTSFFDGYFFMCHQYGHVISNCKYMSSRYSKFYFCYSFPKINVLRCYKCNLFVHVMRNYKTKSFKNDQPYVSLQVDKEFHTKVTKIWRSKINNFMFVQMALHYE